MYLPELLKSVGKKYRKRGSKRAKQWRFFFQPRYWLWRRGKKSRLGQTAEKKIEEN